MCLVIECIAVAEINASSFFKTPFSSLIRPRQLVEYTVINVELVRDGERRKFAGQGALSKKVLSDAFSCWPKTICSRSFSLSMFLLTVGW